MGQILRRHFPHIYRAMPDLAARCFKFCGSSTGRITFASISFQNEFNGVTENRNSNVRPVVKRQFKSFSQAEEENGKAVSTSVFT